MTDKEYAEMVDLVAKAADIRRRLEKWCKWREEVMKVSKIKLFCVSTGESPPRELEVALIPWGEPTEQPILATVNALTAYADSKIDGLRAELGKLPSGVSK